MIDRLLQKNGSFLLFNSVPDNLFIHFLKAMVQSLECFFNPVLPGNYRDILLGEQ